MKPETGLVARVARSTLWMAALTLTGRVIGLVRLLALAHLVPPREFGLAGVGWLTLSFVDAWVTTGTQVSLVQRPRLSERLLDTAWTLDLVRGLLVASAMALLAPSISGLFGVPEAAPLIRLLSLVPLLNGVANPGLAEYRRELSFGRPYALHSIGTVVDLLVSVFVAALTHSGWAIALGWVAMAAARAGASYLLHAFRPSLRLSRQEALRLGRFGGWLLACSAVSWTVSEGVAGGIGHWLGADALGLYQMAWRLGAVPATEIAVMVSGVALAAYSQLQDSTDRLAAGYLRVQRMVAFVAVPVGVGIAVLANDLVALGLGDAWRDVAPLLVPAVLGGFSRCFASTARAVLEARGRPDLAASALFVELAVLVSVFPHLLSTRGLVGAAVAASVSAGLGAALVLFLVSRHLGLRLGTLLGPWVWPLVASTPFASIHGWLAQGTPAALVVALLALAMVYLSLMALFDWERLREVRTILTALASSSTTAWRRADG